MKLEHKKEQIVPIKKFALRVAKYALFGFVLISFSVGMGTIGYHYFGEISLLDSFYMSCMILTGMGPTDVMVGNGAKLFSSFYALYSGVAFLSITAVFLAPIIHRLLHILHIETDDNQ